MDAAVNTIAEQYVHNYVWSHLLNKLLVALAKDTKIKILISNWLTQHLTVKLCSSVTTEEFESRDK